MKTYVIYLFIFLSVLSLTRAEIIPVINLNYDDTAFVSLSESTTSSKNRMIRISRLTKYQPPTIYSYTVKRGEDIWTIIAKTSLNIDSITTLNRFDFIGMVREEKEVFLPDTLGIFFDIREHEKEELAQRFTFNIEDILLVEDPLVTGNRLYFLPEAKLPFLERTFRTGVVFHAPLVGVKTSSYGARIDPFVNEETYHGGVDIASEEGKIVRASRGGKVIYADESNGYGNLVILHHELGYYTLYGHLKEISVELDEGVETGQAVGTVGTTGRTTGSHLHFEIRRYNEPLNPENIPFFFTHMETQEKE